MRYLNAHLAGLIALGIALIFCGWLISGPLTSSAVQNPSISLDMVSTGNTYCDGTGTDNLGNPCSPNNSMTVGTIDHCLAGLGHFLLIEDPPTVAKHVREFIVA